MEKIYFGKTKDGSDVYLYRFTNKNNAQLTVTDLGASWTGFSLPDKTGENVDVILGYDTPQEYIDNTCFFGAVVGRSGNRIDKGTFQINGKQYQMFINDNENNLHSGLNFYHIRKWFVKEVTDNSITFELLSPDGDQGFPGNFHVCVTYTLTDDNTVELHYEGVSDADTVANLTNHVYFNLSGHDSGTVLEQEMMLTAQNYTPVRDGQAIPTGEIASVKGTPMDFLTAKPIGREIDAEFEQLQFVGGYDHNYALCDKPGVMQKFAEVYSEKTGIMMEAATDCCGFQFYAGNFITPHAGKGGVTYGKRSGFCLESQYYPNSINQEGFASPILKTGEKYDTVTSYKFFVKE